MKKLGYTKLIKSVKKDNASVLEMNILPGEKTPWHYHSLFTETFEILKGTLEVGKGSSILTLKMGNRATINVKEKHSYHNVSNEECVVRVTITPANLNFEHSLFILKGLEKDGLATKAGIPKRFSDLALFVYLSNSKMVGFNKIAEPLFTWVANTAIKKGRLNELVEKYCRQNAQFTINGNTAEATCYCLITLIENEGEKKMRTTIGAIYHDVYIREEGRWLIAKRIGNFAWQAKNEVLTISSRDGAYS